MNQQQLEQAKKYLFIALCADILINAISGFDSYSTIKAIEQIRSGARQYNQEFQNSLDFWANFSYLGVLTLIGVGITLVKWLNACYRFAKETIGVSGFKQESWTVTGWIVPFINLVKPYQIINEIYKAGSSNYSGGDDWKKESSSALLLLWWIFWVITHMIIWILVKEIFKKSFRDDVTVQQVINLYYGQVWLDGLSVVIAILWFVVAGWLTQRLIDKATCFNERKKNDSPTKRTKDVAIKKLRESYGYYDDDTDENQSNSKLNVNEKPFYTAQSSINSNDHQRKENNDSHFNDSTIKNFQTINESFEKDWSIALKYYQDLQEIQSRLSKISMPLFYKFRDYMLKEKSFDERKKIADAMEHAFFKSNFGENKEIVELARYLIFVAEDRQAAESLYDAVKIFGDKIDSKRIFNQIKNDFYSCFSKRLVVVDVAKNSQAEKLGIKEGDIFYSFNGVITKSNQVLYQLMESHKFKKNTLKVIRGQQSLDFEVTGEKLGVITKQTTSDYFFNYKN